MPPAAGAASIPNLPPPTIFSFSPAAATPQASTGGNALTGFSFSPAVTAPNSNAAPAATQPSFTFPSSTPSSGFSFGSAAQNNTVTNQSSANPAPPNISSSGFSFGTQTAAPNKLSSFAFNAPASQPAAPATEKKFSFAQPDAQNASAQTTENAPAKEAPFSFAATPSEPSKGNGAFSGFSATPAKTAETQIQPIAVERNTAAFVPSAIKTKTLAEIAARFGAELEEQLKLFKQQAVHLAKNDTLLLENGTEIAALIAEVAQVDAAAKEIAAQLAFLQTQQRELETIVAAVEQSAAERLAADAHTLGFVDERRADVYAAVRSLDAKLTDAEDGIAAAGRSHAVAPNGADAAPPENELHALLLVLATQSSVIHSLAAAIGGVDEAVGRLAAKEAALDAACAKLSAA